MIAVDSPVISTYPANPPYLKGREIYGISGNSCVQNIERAALRAFTLIEMSIVLIVIGLIILTVFPALTSMRSASQRALTDSNLAALMRATAVYVQANGCLPCPTPADGPFNKGFGYVRGDASPDACGNCPNSKAEGIPPYASLGIPPSVAHDGWGRWITMRIDPVLSENFKVAPPSSACLSNDTSPCTLELSKNGICSNSAPCILGQNIKGLCQANILDEQYRIKVRTSPEAYQDAAVIFVSHGANGYGAFTAGSLSNEKNGTRMEFPPNILDCVKNGYERCNSDGDRQFFSATVATGGDKPFDDILAFADRNNLVSLLGNASCQSVW